MAFCKQQNKLRNCSGTFGRDVLVIQVSPTFTVWVDLASQLCSLELGVWGWRSGSRRPALLSHLMDVIPMLLNPCSRDNLVSKSFSENYSSTVGTAGWTHSWVLGWYITLIPAAPATLLLPLAALETNNPAPCGVSHGLMAPNLSWTTSHTSTRGPFLF